MNVYEREKEGGPDRRRLTSRTGRNSNQSSNSPRGQCVDSRTHVKALSGSSWSTKKPVSTLDTRSLGSSGSKREPRSFASLRYVAYWRRLHNRFHILLYELKRNRVNVTYPYSELTLNNKNRALLKR